MMSLPAPQFFAMATRMPAYQGVMRSVVEAEMVKREKEQQRTGGKGVIKLTPAMAKAGAVQGTPTEGLQGLIDFG